MSPAPGTMRLFVAARVPTFPPLAALLSELGATKGLSAPRPEALHFTLKFLGETEDALLPTVQDALGGAVAGSAPFPLALAGTGTFPPRGAPRVLWAGVTRGAHELVALARSVEEALAARGFPREDRPFVPHLTLARVKGHRVAETVVAIAERHRDTEWGGAEIGAIHLVRSQLRPGGSVYADLSAHRLGGG